MSRDFDLSLVPVVKEEMIAFWKDRKGRNELQLAIAWEKTYIMSNLSRVLLVEHYALRGGMPNDSSQTEESASHLDRIPTF